MNWATLMREAQRAIQQVGTYAGIGVSGHFDDVDYLERVSEVVERVCAALPQIAESVGVDDLAKHIKVARNEMAHQIPLDHEDEPLEVRYLRWLVVTQVTPWLLRGLLLLATDIEPGVLREGHSENSRFFHFARQSDHTWCRTREKVCCRARRSTKR